jgi:oxygen-dependent protoporphyrinogen oxidase
VVLGGGVAGLAAAWGLSLAGVEVILLERAERLGGLVESERTPEGALLEHGADGLLADKVGGHEVLVALGLEGSIVRGGRAPKRAFVTDADRLVEMPGGLFAFERRAMWTMLASPLLSARAKLGLLVEPLHRASREGDESVRAFFERRMGPEVADKLVAPMVHGIFGAPASDVGMRSVFPKLASMESRFGSLGLALLLARRAPRGHGLVSLAGGMDSLPRALADAAARAGARIETGRGARSIVRDGSGAAVVLDDGAALRASHVVVATGVRAASRLLERAAPDAAALLSDVGASDAEIVSFVGPRSMVDHPLDGTGLVVSHDPTRARATLACTFASEKWHGRAPEGTVVLRSVLRGEHARSETELVALAREELRDLVGLRGTPTSTHVRRRREALPVYAVGHADRVARLHAALEASKIVSVAGNHLRGVGVPDAIATGLEAARSLSGRDGLSSRDGG